MKISRKPHLIKPDPPHASADLPALRERLLEARRRLIKLVAEDPPDRMFPNPAWVKMLADVQGAIEAVMAEDRP